jgi:hypothetical protein
MTTIAQTDAINQSPYLRTSRNIPFDQQALVVELTNIYIDIASKVNARTIGLFPTERFAVNGESWFLTQDQRQQGLRQVYPFTAAGNIAHGLNFSSISAFTKIYGTFTDGTNWYPLPYVDVVAANNQVNIYVTATNIVITAGGGSPPAITSGIAVLEWISLV